MECFPSKSLTVRFLFKRSDEILKNVMQESSDQSMNEENFGEVRCPFRIIKRAKRDELEEGMSDLSSSESSDNGTASQLQDSSKNLGEKCARVQGFTRVQPRRPMVPTGRMPNYELFNPLFSQQLG
jgi:hypothetical protein